MPKLFGFSIEEDPKLPKSAISPVPENNEDGVDYYITSGFYGQYVDIEGVFRNEYDLIRRYREMALHPECDNAIENIVNEAIISDLNDSPIEIELSNLNASDGLKKIIRDEFKYIKDLMDFDKKSHEIFRNWYVDGRLLYHKVIDLKKPEEGIKDIRNIDPLKTKFMRVERKTGQELGKAYTIDSKDRDAFIEPEIDEYFMYFPESSIQKHASSGKGIQIAKDAVTFVTSGLVDRNRKLTLSYMHKAIKALNQLRMIEDALVIYRLSRAPERRIFYIDVGNLPKVKAEQYLRDVMNRYRNKLVYDANTGEMRDDKRFMSMMEDFWLPRREGGRGTEITTLPGGQNLGELTDVHYFQKKLFRALNVPESRTASDGGFNLGRSSEILRDELMFGKFIGRLRKRFCNLFHDMLKTQLILKNIVTPEDWEKISDHIQYDYLYDSHFAELKETELMNERLNLAAAVQPYIGTYYSKDYVRRKILRQTDQEIIDQDKMIKKEIQQGDYADPKENPPMGPGGSPILPVSVDQQMQMLGQVPMEPGLEDQGVATDAQAKSATKINTKAAEI
jgi:hypothetical protein